MSQLLSIPSYVSIPFYVPIILISLPCLNYLLCFSIPSHVPIIRSSLPCPNYNSLLCPELLSILFLSTVFLTGGQHKPAWLAHLLLLAGDVERNPGPRIPSNKEISIARWKKNNEEKRKTLAQRRSGKRSSQNAKQNASEKVADAARKVLERSNKTAEQKASEKVANTAQKALERSNQTAKQKAAQKVAHTAQKALERSNQTAKQKAAQKVANTAQKALERSNQTAKQKAAQKVAHTAQKALERSNQTAEQKAAEKVANTAQKALERSNQTAKQTAADKVANAAQKALERTMQTIEKADSDRASAKKRTSKRRHSQSGEATAVERAETAARASKRRCEQTDEERDEVRATAAEMMARKRSMQSPAERYADRSSSSQRAAARRSVDVPAENGSGNDEAVDTDGARRRSRRTIDVEQSLDDVPQCTKDFNRKMASIEMKFCEICRERSPMLTMSNRSTCRRCHSDKRHPRRFSANNEMDPGVVPPELLGLTRVEQMLIARVAPMMMVYRLPFGQYGYRGNIINLPQMVEEFLQTLPRRPSDLDILVVRKIGTNNTHCDFRVRRQRVRQALEWLKLHNKWYKCIEIDEDVLRSLPEDGNIDVDDLILPSDPDDNFVGAGETTDVNVSEHDDDDQLLEATVLPSGAPQRSENDLVAEAVGRLLEGNDADEDDDDVLCNIGSLYDEAVTTSPERTIEWPRVQNQPIDEFESVGYMAMAFPTLFPTGSTDYNDIRRRWDKEHNISLSDYFTHLLKYDDQRFARHARFRYFAFNTIMRHRAMATGNFYLKQHPRDAALDMDDLLGMDAAERKRLFKRIMRYGSSLRGSKAYWLARQSELVNLIDQMDGMPTLFFTISSADLHWPELHDLMPGYDSRAKAVNENPLLCDWFFYKRLEVLLETVLPALGMTDFWLRIEWQHRGSGHAHGIMYNTLPEGLDIQKMASGLPEEVAKVLAFYSDVIKITCINPAKDLSGSGNPAPPTENPCKKRFADITDYSEDLSDLVRTCQLHSKCMPDRCLRLVNGKYQCRFNFPKDLRQSAEIVYEEEDGVSIPTQFEPQRNDPIVNNYIGTLLQAHRANMDAKAILTMEKLLSYIVKYIGKPDSRSQLMRELFDVFFAQTDPAKQNPIRKLTQRILISSISERDYCGQEVMHLMAGLSLYKCSRHLAHISLHGNRNIKFPNMEDDDDEAAEATVNSNDIDKYITRGLEYEHLSMKQFYAKYWFKGTRVVKYRKTAIVIPHPAVRPVRPDNENYEDYCFYYLVLNRPFRAINDLTDGFETSAAAFTRHVESAGGHVIGQSLQNEMSEAQRRRDLEDDGGEPDRDRLDEGEFQDDWQILARINPEFLSRETALANGQVINWDSISSKYQLDYDKLLTFISDNKLTWLVPQTDLSDYEFQKLNETQRRLYDLVRDHSLMCDPTPLRVIVYGPAGTGKSYVLRCLQRLLGPKQKTICPTGIEAHEVGGSTAHSTLKIPVNKDFVPLEGSAKAELQESFVGVNYVFADEMSMFGGAMLGKIDVRLREACSTTNDIVFGGMSFIFLGDHAQLPPVRDVVLFHNGVRSRSDLADRGRRVYQTFDRVIWLEDIVRQNSIDGLRGILGNIRNGVTNISDFTTLTAVENASIEGKLPVDGMSRFRQCQHIFSRREPTALYNEARLAENSHVITIHALHSGAENSAAKVSSETSRGLSAVLRLAPGAKVSICGFNLWTEVGLSNGSDGTIIDIIYRDGSPPQLPTCVLVDFPGYTGPSIIPGRSQLVAVTPQTAYFTTNGIECSRTQIPLQLCYGSTIHKVQGKTLPTTKVDLGDSEFSSGLTYTGCSRTRALKDLMTTGLTFRRYQMAGDSRSLYYRLLEEKRLGQMDGKCAIPDIPTHLQKYATDAPPRQPRQKQNVVRADKAKSRKRALNSVAENPLPQCYADRVAKIPRDRAEQQSHIRDAPVQVTSKHSTAQLPLERLFVNDFDALKLFAESEHASPWGIPISLYSRLRAAGNGDCLWNSLAYFTTGKRFVSTADAMMIKHKMIELIDSSEYSEQVLTIFAGTDEFQFEADVQTPSAYLSEKRSPNNRMLREDFAWGQADDLEFIATAAQCSIELVTSEMDGEVECLRSRVISSHFEMPRTIKFLEDLRYRPTLYYSAHHFDPLVVEETIRR